MKCYWDKQVSFFPLAVEIRKKFKKKKKSKNRNQEGQLSTKVHWQPAGDWHLSFICILKIHSCCQASRVDVPYLEQEKPEPKTSAAVPGLEVKALLYEGHSHARILNKGRKSPMATTLNKHKAHFNGQLKCPEETDINHPHTHPRHSFVSTSDSSSLECCLVF